MPGIELRFGRDILVLEGGWGTMLERYGVTDEPCPEILNIIEPDLVTEIHRLYTTAGATCAITNTFSGSRRALAAHGLADSMEDINRRGVKLAASHRPQHVLADMGSCGAWDDDSKEAQEEAWMEYADQARALASAGPDAIYLETMAHLGDALCALRAVKTVCDLPVIVSMAVDADGLTIGCRTSIEEASRSLSESGADVVGINCVLNPSEVLGPAERLAASCSLPLLCCPDVGSPVVGQDGSTSFDGTPDDMETCATKLREMGFQMIGSCCGSTPAFTGAVYAATGDSEVVGRDRRLGDE